jgi:hypothetical protein
MDCTVGGTCLTRGAINFSAPVDRAIDLTEPFARLNKVGGNRWAFQDTTSFQATNECHVC